jgi:hypothetical protein
MERPGGVTRGLARSSRRPFGPVLDQNRHFRGPEEAENAEKAGTFRVSDADYEAVGELPCQTEVRCLERLPAIVILNNAFLAITPASSNCYCPR